jgi:DNA-binding GntR family transcriptional regulator
MSGQIMANGHTPAAADRRRTSAQDGASADTPLYLQVAAALRDAIVDGTYPVGSLLPTEDALCERFSVSRYTVRAALRLLRDDGLVHSRRGAGTFVAPPPASVADGRQVMSINDLVAFASGTRFSITSIRTVALTRKLAARTGLPEATQWLQVQGCRLSPVDESVECMTEYYIHRSFAAVGRLLPRHAGPVFPLLEDMFGQKIVEVQQQISAALVSPGQAATLGVEPGSAALEVRRSYTTGEGTVAQVTLNTHPASRFQHIMTMRRMTV